jgi:hypothetical protein
MSEVIQDLIDSKIEHVHTCIPGRIVSYKGHAKRLATVQPSVRIPTPAGPLLDVPPIIDVPVVFPSTLAGSLLFPVRAGDGVLIIVSEVGIGKWLQSAVDASIVDPDDASRHTLTDAIAIPGLWPLPSVPPSLASSDDSVVLYSEGGSVVELGAKIGIRNAASDERAELEKIYAGLVALRQDLALNFQALGAGILADVAFMTTTATAASNAATLHTKSITRIDSEKQSLKELYK